ncbi:MAG TPA: hypothetical protein VGM51_08670 [Armatimonadota bacterium]|jgi:hypothetical protein
MAILHWRDGEEIHGDVYLEVAPVPASPETAEFEYNIAFQSGTDRYERRYTVANWELLDRTVYRLARAFARVREIPPGGLPEQPFTESGVPLLDQALSAFVDNFWLKVCVEAREPDLGGSFIIVHTWLATDWQDGPACQSGFREFVYFKIISTPEAVRVFGEQLTAECLNAARERVRFGIGTHDDYDYLNIPVPEEMIAEELTLSNELNRSYEENP